MTTDSSWLGPAIDVRPLFAGQHSAHLRLLRGLDETDWLLPTRCPGWTVKDIAAHLLGDHTGRLSAWRDDFPGPHPSGGEPFEAFIHRANEQWVSTTRRISPRLLTDLLASVGDQVVQFWNSVDLGAHGWPVSWAGADPAPLWLDAARDLTEYWTHHQQICEATGQPGLDDPEYLRPVIDTFLRALPHTMKDVDAPPHTTLEVVVTGPGEGTWSCTRTTAHWALHHGSTPYPDSRLTLDTDTTWRLCTRAISPENAITKTHIDGDQNLAHAALTIISIIR